MVILGFMLNYALRVNLTIAIVDMVEHVATNGDTHGGGDGGGGNFTAILNGNGGEEFPSSTMAPTSHPHSDSKKFQWSAYEQNLILGCFFWGYILTELPGGRLAEIIGGRRVFGHSMLWASVLSLITPAAALLDFKALIVVRVVLGFFLGASWPAILPLSSMWIPPMDRSKFIANMMGG